MPHPLKCKGAGFDFRFARPRYLPGQPLLRLRCSKTGRRTLRRFSRSRFERAKERFAILRFGVRVISCVNFFFRYQTSGAGRSGVFLLLILAGTTTQACPLTLQDKRLIQPEGAPRFGAFPNRGSSPWGARAPCALCKGAGSPSALNCRPSTRPPKPRPIAPLNPAFKINMLDHGSTTFVRLTFASEVAPSRPNRSSVSCNQLNKSRMPS